MRIVHADNYTQVLLNSWHEEFKESPAFILISHFFLKLRKNWFKFFWSIKTWNFTCGYKWIQVFKEFSLDYMMIFNQQAYLLSLNTCLLKNHFKISLEFFHAIFSINIWREEWHIEHVSNQLCCSLSAYTRPACHQHATTRLRESPLSEGN